MKFLYWNTKSLDDLTLVYNLCIQEQPEVFFLSEIKSELLRESNELKGLGYVLVENPGCDRVNILKKTIVELDLDLQNKYYTAISFSQYDLYVISVHFPSQMYQHFDALKAHIREFRKEIDLRIGSPLEKRILIIGDLNVNPYEKPMIDFDGFSANNSINSRKHITHLGKTVNTYYNPTWQLYARNFFPGTKYFPRPSGATYDILEHHFLDQVIISPKLLESITEDKIEIIETVNKFLLLDKVKFQIFGSDHLPISYQFNFKK